MNDEVNLLCELAKVSKSGYYRWLKIADLPDPDKEDYQLINQIFEKGKKKLGYRAVTMKLPKDRKMNHKKVARIMTKFGLKAKIRRKNPYKEIMKKTQEHRTCENLLNRQFNQLVPFRILCTDITYIWFNGRFVYLSAIKDIASGEIVAWSVSCHIDMELVFQTIEGLKIYAKEMSLNLNNLMLHSDQGFQYTSPQYIELIKHFGIRQSMSRKGNCIDNSPMESFWGHFKDEVEFHSCKTFQELRQVIAEYIHYFNNERPQWDLKKMTPVEYRNHLLICC